MLPDFLYGTAWKEDRTAALVELAIGAGFRGIDTANQRRHYNEAAVGEALAVAYRTGTVQRSDLFLQTKFTYRPGQDHRLPYDPSAPLAAQVAQSMLSSLQHLNTEYVDSFLLHGPASGYGGSQVDSEVWHAMLGERDAGRTRFVGVSNVSLRHLEQMLALGQAPEFVQNRCFAVTGWDYAVRQLCRERGILYQGFSLLTANQEVVLHPVVSDIAAREQLTPAQVIFAFARGVGMLPLTGTSNSEHMRRDLASREVKLSGTDLEQIESIAA